MFPTEQGRAFCLEGAMRRILLLLILVMGLGWWALPMSEAEASSCLTRDNLIALPPGSLAPVLCNQYGQLYAVGVRSDGTQVAMQAPAAPYWQPVRYESPFLYRTAGSAGLTCTTSNSPTTYPIGQATPVACNQYGQLLIEVSGEVTATTIATQTVAGLPGGPATGTIRYVTDGTDATDCTEGGGTALVTCIFDGTTWVNIGSGGVTGWPTVITGAAETSESTPLKIRGPGALSDDGWNIYVHSGGKPTIRCVVNGVEGDCNVEVVLEDDKKYQIIGDEAQVLFEVDETTGAVTGETVWDLDLVAVNPADGVASHIWNKDPLSTACTPLAVTGTNRTTGYCTFTDADGDQGVQISRALPARMQGILDADVWWKTTGTGNARFQFQTKCYADDEADDAAFNTASVVTAAAGTSGRPNKQTISAITLTGCAAGELMRIRFFRNRTEGSDTLNAALDVEKVVFRLR